MNKKIIISLSVIGAIAAIAVGGTIAYFSDVESSTGNSFAAGTLNLTNVISGTAVSSSVVVNEQADGLNDSVVFGSTDPMKPGSSGTITWTLSNTGNIAGNLTLVSTVTSADVDANEPEAAVTIPHANNGGSNGDLDEFVGVTLQRGTGVDQTAAEGAFTYIMGSATGYVPFSGLEAILDAELNKAMAANGGADTIVYKLSWNIATDIKGAGTDVIFGTGDDVSADDNIIQSDTAQLDITFTLNQQ